ncbi:MAG: glycosyltransferase family 4 protein [Planctomycetaceae bacterium]|jgi:mannosylglucosylglycerate synthase|nr:glycosyltransferase family 4 protein [Planctomycetaceae bacterium]MBT6484688.1 glycosyltransferase family 4 protein [Planctomycetaceae bacterium]MBT6493531.1 glycosyltransferase family 4 protein [Planctomycetaceae bacterium]
MNPQHIGFVSTRFSGTDGVSLESSKWAQVLWDHRHVSYWFAGELDRDPAISMLVPEAHFSHPEVLAIGKQAFGQLKRESDLTRKINELADFLKRTIYDFVERFSIDILVVQNALCIPMNIPLGVALTHFIAETEFPTIAHHHDFYWERDRFAVNSVGDFLEMAFPPRLPSIQHVTINSFAQQDLAHRRGCPSILVPNVLDFEKPPEESDQYAADFRSEIGLSPDDIMVLQPTRVVPRKGIEHSIALMAQLNDPRFKLVVTHAAGDEGFEYLDSLVEMADRAGVDLRFVDTIIGDSRFSDASGRKQYSLWDTYPHADIVTYPSLYEGFGNALLEAFYFRKPVMVNRYSIFQVDIEPKGFEVISMDGFLTKSVAQQVRRVIEDEQYREDMVNHNYELATKFFGYSVLKRKLRALVCNFTGQDDL